MQTIQACEALPPSCGEYGFRVDDEHLTHSVVRSRSAQTQTSRDATLIRLSATSSNCSRNLHAGALLSGALRCSNLGMPLWRTVATLAISLEQISQSPYNLGMLGINVFPLIRIAGKIVELAPGSARLRHRHGQRDD